MTCRAPSNNQRIDDSLSYHSQPSFSQQIMEEVIPPYFKMPQLVSYDGTFDSLDHLGSYRTHMMIQGASDALRYLAFPTTLEKATYVWYSSLKPESIHSFNQLEKLFMAYFRISWMMPRNSNSLFSIQQKGKTLRDCGTLQYCHN